MTPDKSMIPTDNNWFTEICKEGGSAFSLQVDEKLHDETTPFQRIEIYSTTHFGNLMLIDGFVMLTGRDNFLYHEMMAHPVLFTHPDPQTIVIIGGGDCGTLREVLRHPGIQHVVQVEIDERVTKLSEQYFPELCESNNDPRVTFDFGDGIQRMKDTPAGSIDVIIVDSTDPIGPAKGLFTEHFYRDCYNALGADGMIAQQSESPLLHYDSIIMPMHKAMRAAGFSDSISLQFPQPCYPSGWWTATLAGKRNIRDFRSEAAQQKTFPTRYYNAAIHHSALAQPEFFVSDRGLS